MFIDLVQASNCTRFIVLLTKGLPENRAAVKFSRGLRDWWIHIFKGATWADLGGLESGDISLSRLGNEEAIRSIWTADTTRE